MLLVLHNGGRDGWQGQREVQCGAPLRCALAPDAPVVALQDACDDGQAAADTLEFILVGGPSVGVGLAGSRISWVIAGSS